MAAAKKQPQWRVKGVSREIREHTDRWTSKRDVFALLGLIEADAALPDEVLSRFRDAIRRYVHHGADPKLSQILTGERRIGRSANARSRAVLAREHDVIHAVLVGVMQAGWTGYDRFVRAEEWLRRQEAPLGGHPAGDRLSATRTEYINELYYRSQKKGGLRYRAVASQDLDALAMMVSQSVEQGSSKKSPAWTEPDPERPGWYRLHSYQFDPTSETWKPGGVVRFGEIREVVRTKSRRSSNR